MANEEEVKKLERVLDFQKLDVVFEKFDEATDQTYMSILEDYVKDTRASKEFNKNTKTSKNQGSSAGSGTV